MARKRCRKYRACCETGALPNGGPRGHVYECPQVSTSLPGLQLVPRPPLPAVQWRVAELTGWRRRPKLLLSKIDYFQVVFTLPSYCGR